MRLLAFVLALAVVAGPARAQLLDSDGRVFSTDKLEHIAGGAALDLGFQPFVQSRATRLLLVGAAGLVFEFGQFDAARGTEYQGRPGYGIGLLDLGADLIGALVTEGLCLIAARVF